MGVVLVSGRASPGASETARATGVAFGLAAALFYGVGGFLLGRYTREFGWLVPALLARAGAMALLLGLAATPVRRVMGSRPGPGVAWALGAGLADAAGVAFFARGGQAGLVAITAAASSAYPVIPLIGGLVLLHERMTRWQAIGAALILTGLVLLGALAPDRAGPAGAGPDRAGAAGAGSEPAGHRARRLAAAGPVMHSGRRRGRPAACRM